jgi:hypothetical protein
MRRKRLCAAIPKRFRPAPRWASGRRKASAGTAGCPRPRSLGRPPHFGSDGVGRSLGGELRRQSRSRSDRVSHLDPRAVHSNDAHRQALGDWSSDSPSDAVAELQPADRRGPARDIRVPSHAQAGTERGAAPDPTGCRGSFAMSPQSKQTDFGIKPVGGEGRE